MSTHTRGEEFRRPEPEGDIGKEKSGDHEAQDADGSGDERSDGGYGQGATPFPFWPF